MSLNLFVMKVTNFALLKALACLILLFFIVASNGNSVVLARRQQIKTANGDVIDCVNIYEQPALKHPSMKNHTIQMRPSQPSPFEKQTASVQLKERMMCPEGTIPILRTENKKELYMNFTDKDNVKYEYAIAYKNGDIFSGVSGEIYIWHSYAELNDLSFNMVGCELSNGNQLQSRIFAGHGVFPGIYKDTQTRIFVGVLSASESHGCINEDCKDFVRVGGSNIYLGSAYGDKSYCHYGDPNYQRGMSVGIHRDPNSDKWWVSFNEQQIGYFGGKTALDIVSCNSVMWGGTVITQGGKPTPTQMGNGHFPNEGRTKAGAIVHALYNSQKEGLSGGDPSGVLVSRSECYDFKDLGPGADVAGHVFLYGGPGCST